MNISRENFEERLPELIAAIHDADFISYDFEFTGLFLERERGFIDTPSERYERNSRQCVKFLPIQIGLCIFKHKEVGSYSCEAFSVCLFPHSSEISRLPDRCYVMQSSSIDFLVQHKFDFNKAFYHGVGFASMTEIEERKKSLEQQFKALSEEIQENKAKDAPIPRNMEQFFEEKSNLVKEFMESNPSPEDELVFKKLNFVQRKILLLHLPKIDDSLNITTEYSPADGHFLVIRISRDGSRDIRKMLAEKRDKLKKQADKLAGFSEVISAMSQSKALLIGHNQGIDLLHTLHHFIHPLPQSYSEFKEFATSTFPRLVDTKYLASSEPFKDLFPSTSLNKVFETTETEPFPTIRLDPPAEQLSEKKFHDAAFDAFCTGRTFLSMLELLREQHPADDFLESVDTWLAPFLHRIPIMGSILINHWNLAGPDEIKNCDDLFHASFPAKWRMDDLTDAFAPVCPDGNGIRVYWIDKWSAWIKVYEPNDPVKVEGLSDPSIPFDVCSYANFQKRKSTSTEPSQKRRKREKTPEDTPKSGSNPTFDVPNDW